MMNKWKANNMVGKIIRWLVGSLLVVLVMAFVFGLIQILEWIFE